MSQDTKDRPKRLMMLLENIRLQCLHRDIAQIQGLTAKSLCLAWSLAEADSI